MWLRITRFSFGPATAGDAGHEAVPSYSVPLVGARSSVKGRFADSWT